MYANRDCQHCLEYAYDDNPESKNYGKIEEFGNGRLQKRHPKHLPLCQKPKGCPKGTPEKPNTLSAKNRKAYRHYTECRAVGHFPDDPIVRRNASVIRSVEDYASEKRRIDELTALMGVAVQK